MKTIKLNSQFSKPIFYGLLLFFITMNLLLTYGATFFGPEKYNAGFFVLVGVIVPLTALAIPLIGSLIFKSELMMTVLYIVKSLIISICIGLLSPAFLNNFSPDLIQHALILTMLITIVMSISGFLFQKFYERIGNVLMFSLFILILVEVFNYFIPVINLSYLDIISAIIFSLFIGYDVYVASKVERTLLSAIDCGCNIYLNIINLFVDILSYFKHVD